MPKFASVDRCSSGRPPAFKKADKRSLAWWVVRTTEANLTCPSASSITGLMFSTPPIMVTAAGRRPLRRR